MAEAMLKLVLLSEKFWQKFKIPIIKQLHIEHYVPFSLQQGSLQIYLKSKNGPIEVYLCPEEGLEDASPVKSLVTPKKEFPQPLCPPAATPMAPASYSIKEEPVECKRGKINIYVLAWGAGAGKSGDN